MNTALDLFNPPPARERTETEIGLARAEDAATPHARFIERLRELVRRDYRNRVVTTDQVWSTMDRHDLTMPADMHPNALGSFFTGWEHAEEVYVGEGPDRMRARRRSTREGSHGNLLSVWRIV